MTGKMNTVLTLTLAIGLILFISACRDDKKKNEADKGKMELKLEEPHYDTTPLNQSGVKNTIMAYTEALAQAHMADPYFPVLRKFATDKEVQKIFIEDRFNTDRGLAMRSWLKQMIFENVTISGDKGTADTSEMWEFDYIDIKTKAVVEPKQKVTYKLRYDLIRENDHWVVSEVKERQPRVFE